MLVNKGFTLVELTIVLVILAVIGITVHNYSNSTSQVTNINQIIKSK